METVNSDVTTALDTNQMEPGGVEWLYALERRAIIPVKWLMCLLCVVLSVVRSPDYIPTIPEFFLLIVYFSTNAVFSYLIYLDRVKPHELRPFSLVSFTIDLLIMIGFIYLTGGITSNFYILFFLVILRGMGFFQSKWLNLTANVFVGLVYVATLMLAGIDWNVLDQHVLLEKILLVIGVVLVSWYLIEIQSQQRQHLMDTNRRLIYETNYVQNLLEAMADGVIAFDGELRVTTINGAAKKILKFPGQDSTVEFEYLEWIPDEVLQVCRLYIQTGQETTDRTLDIHLKDGERKTIRLSTHRLEAIQGGLAGVVLIFEDLSSLRQIEEQLWQSEKLASVGQLAAGVAHELGNPIGIIKSCAEYMKKELGKSSGADPVTESLKEEILVITSESARCQRILKELLSYSTEDVVELADYNLNDIAEKVLGLVAYNIPEDRVGIVVDLYHEPVWIKADSNLLLQALVNIMLNAVQSIEGQGRVTVSTGKQPADQGSPAMAVIEIADTGCGIPEEKQQKIFEPFYTTRDEGTGLGLAITHKIIDRMGGTIQLSSKVGEGTSFRILLQKGIAGRGGN